MFFKFTTKFLLGLFGTCLIFVTLMCKTKTAFILLHKLHCVSKNQSKLFLS